MIFGEDGFWWYETRHLRKQLDQMRIDNHQLRARVKRLEGALRPLVPGFEEGCAGEYILYVRVEDYDIARAALEEDGG